ncbi:MAG: host attachment protein [Thermomicrobiales bacterium]|jgi:hypothetical protein|nr:host attachment protein [Thermomicrobiales bacterium]
MAATDPVQSIVEATHEHAVLSDLDMTLRRLAALPPSNGTPYLTALLDWQPDGSAPFQRQAQVLARDAANAIIADQEKRSAALESLTADVEGITKAIQEDIDPATRGIFAVGNGGQGVLHVEPLGVPVETSVTAGPIPMLKRLAQMVEDYPLHALLQSDQDTAILSFVTEDVVSETVTVRGSLYPRRQKSGGLSQRRYKARADERVQAFAKAVAAETQKALEETGCRRLVLAASEVMEPALLNAFHQSVTDKVIGSIRIDIDAPFDEVLAKARPLAVDFERRREAAQVEEVLNALSTGNAVAGTVDVLNALRNGQVHRLIMTRVYSQPGWIDPEMQLFGIGDPPAEHPAGGDITNLLSVPLEEEMIRQAVQSGSQIEIVKGTLGVDANADIPAAGQSAPRKETVQPLDDLGGVAAMLRFAI